MSQETPKPSSLAAPGSGSPSKPLALKDWLAEASIADLADFLRQRFQMTGPMAAEMGGHKEELPHEFPLLLWRHADRLRKADLEEATRLLIEEIPAPGWTAEAVEWLATFIEQAGMHRVEDALQTAAETQRWLGALDDGPRCHMLALRALRGLGRTLTEQGWRDLPDSFRRRYPELVFGGLLALDHSMGLAFDELPNLIESPEGVRRIMDALSTLMRSTENRPHVRDRLLDAGLSDDILREFDKWFGVRGWGGLVTDAVGANWCYEPGKAEDIEAMLASGGVKD